MKILIVDDAVFIRKILKGIFAELGHQDIAEAATGQEAIKLAEKLKPELITLDITMPDIDGIMAMKKIKEVSPDSNIVMVSATSNQSLILDALKNGATNFITKPFTKEKVEEIVSSLYDNKNKINDFKIINDEFITTIIINVSSNITYNTFENYSKRYINIKFENCKLSNVIKEYYQLSNGPVEEIIFKTNTDDSIDLFIITDSNNYKIIEQESRIEIIVNSLEASVNWVAHQRKILFKNIPNKYIKIQEIDEKSINIEIHNRAVSLTEFNNKINDEIIDSINVNKSAFGYTCTIYFTNIVQYQLDENEFSTELILKQYVEINDFEITNNIDETNINIFLSGYILYSSKRDEKNNLIIQLENSTLSEKLSKKNSFDVGLAECILFEKLDNNVVVKIITRVARTNVTLENNVLMIKLRANKAYILYDFATPKLIFQNIKKENTIFELKDDKKCLAFTINDRYINLIKDVISKDDKLISDIKISKENTTYYGTILFKNQIKFSIEESKDKNSFFIILSLFDYFSIINSFELENFSKEIKLKICYNKKVDFTYEYYEIEKYLLLKLQNTKIEKIEQSPYTFSDGFIEKIHFYQSGPDTFIKIFTEINHFEAIAFEEFLEIIFKPVICNLDFDIENNKLTFSNVSENNIMVTEEEFQINLLIYDKKLFLSTGVFEFENSIINAIQISRISTGYNVIIYVKSPIKYKIIQEGNDLLFLIKAYCKITNIEFINNEDFYINIYYSGELLFETKNIEQNIIQIDLFDVLFNNINTENIIKNSEIVKNINIFESNEGNITIEIEPVIAKINIKDNKNDGILGIVLQKAYGTIIYSERDKTIKFECVFYPTVEFHEFNNLLLVKLTKNINRLKIINLDLNDEYIKFIHSYDTNDYFIVYILFNKNMIINWFIEQDNLFINFDDKKQELEDKLQIININQSKELMDMNNNINKYKKQPIIYLDAGHGGRNLGGVFEKFENGKIQKYFEKDINLNISKKLANCLNKFGYEVRLTRKDDRDLSTKERLSIINKNELSLFISIHIGASANKQIRGLNIYYSHEEREIDIINLANLIKDKMNNENLIPVKDIVKGNEIGILEKSDIPSLLLQIGHGTNIYDLINLIDDKYLNRIIDIIAESIYAYFSK